MATGRSHDSRRLTCPSSAGGGSSWDGDRLAGHLNQWEERIGVVSALERSSTPAELIDRMTAEHPDLANPYTLWVAAYDQLGTNLG